MTHHDAYESTSERMDETSSYRNPGDYLIYLFHIAAYRFAAARVQGMTVLDYGCGTGYGSRHLARVAESVTGVDVSTSAIDYARSRYPGDRLSFDVIRPVEQGPLPFADASFDAVVSFQVIEHVPSPDLYLAEAARVLRTGGLFLCATPDRGTRLRPAQRPWNRWHLDEFSPDALREVASKHFEVEELLSMTAPPEVVDLELQRCATLRRVTTPFTFRGAPEWWRSRGLGVLARAQGIVDRARQHVREDDAPVSVENAPSTFGFDASQVEISASASPSTNIVLVAVRPDRAQE